MAHSRADLLQGTLDMLVMRAVADEPLHGYALVHRLENQGVLKAEWKRTESGREAKFYRLTAKGRKRLEADVAEWRELSTAISLILGPG